MQISFSAKTAIEQSAKQIKDQVAVSILKKSMDQTKQMMRELIQKNLQPPKNMDGSISVYA